jgi:hypothetical protein
VGPGLILAVTLAASTAAAERALPPWLLAGEQLTYQMSYLRLVSGTMVMEAERQEGNQPLRLRMRATSSRVVSRFAEIDESQESIVDPQRRTVLRSHKESRGRRRSTEIVTFDPDAGTAHRVKNGVDRGTFATPVPILDSLAAIFVLRTLPLAPGRAFSLDVEANGKVYPLVVIVSGPETIRTQDGPVETFVVEPRFREGGLFRQRGTMVLWVTTDPTHTPLRIRSELPFGLLTATLMDARREPAEVGVLESVHRTDHPERDTNGAQAR